MQALAQPGARRLQPTPSRVRTQHRAGDKGRQSRPGWARKRSGAALSATCKGCWMSERCEPCRYGYTVTCGVRILQLGDGSEGSVWLGTWFLPSPPGDTHSYRTQGSS